MGLKHNTESDTESYVKKNIVVNESDMSRQVHRSSSSS